MCRRGQLPPYRRRATSSWALENWKAPPPFLRQGNRDKYVNWGKGEESGELTVEVKAREKGEIRVLRGPG